ncbi:MAG: phenylalanine--tRNA ligase subunit beta [Pyrinomonadaceae bacterium]
MFISCNWLRELTGTKLTPDEIQDRLTNVGLAIDSVEARGDDFVLDVEVPSNRGDCLSHVGIARELAAIEKLKVESPKSQIQNAHGKTTDFAAVEIVDPDLCSRYAARVVRGVKIASSPAWLVKKLEAIGQRPINNAADITNYVLHELGQPLHAFDLAKLRGNRIVVRRARTGEAIRTLDAVERKLDTEMLVIADANKAVAIAGVMGGEESEISKSTLDVLIESAYFDPSSVRRTARMLGLHTEASHRFERNTDLEGVLAAQDRCVALICEICGGVATEDALDVYPKPFASTLVSLRPGRVEALTSLRVAESEMKRLLQALGFALRSTDESALTFTVPSWRHDVASEEDLVEEIARHTGYDRIATELPPASLAGEYHFTEKQKRALRQALSGRGFDEAISLSFIESTNEFELIPELANQPTVKLMNPIIEEAASMRQTLLPGLLNSIRHNFNQGIRDVCLLETGRIFAASNQGELPREREAMALVATGGVMEADRAQPARALEFLDLKGAAEAAVEAMNLSELRYESALVKHLRPGQSAKIFTDLAQIGTIGLLSEAIAGNYKFRQPVFVAELDLTALLETPQRAVLYSPLPRFPSIVRDVSLLLDRSVSVANLINSVRSEKTAYFVGVTFVGTYEGKGIADDKRSVTLRFEYRADDRTLRDEEVDQNHWPLVRGLQKKFNAEIR